MGTAPAFSTSTYPSTNAANTLLYASSANTMSALATANSGVLVTSSGGVPSIGTKILGANGGGLILISSQSASASANISFTGLTAYRSYVLTITTAQPATNNTQLKLFVSNTNGASYAVTGYTNGVNYSVYNSAVITNVSDTTSIPLTNGMSNAGVCSANLILHNLGIGTFCVAQGHTSWNDVAAAATVAGYLTGITGTTGVNAIKLQYSAGNIGTGTFTLYGLQVT